MVLDRLFLWIFAIASVLGTFVILCEAPSFCGEVHPAMDLKNTFIPSHRNQSGWQLNVSSRSVRLNYFSPNMLIYIYKLKMVVSSFACTFVFISLSIFFCVFLMSVVFFSLANAIGYTAYKKLCLGIIIWYNIGTASSSGVEAYEIWPYVRYIDAFSKVVNVPIIYLSIYLFIYSFFFHIV